jgi:hypothetical protein
MRKLSGSFTLAVVVFAAAGLGCEPAQPAMPSYSVDVGQVLDAHCVRCHGAGGVLSGDPTNELGAPVTCFLDTFEDVGDCVTDPVNCKIGAKNCAPLFPVFLLTMPPPPAMLNDWERELLTNWAKAPIP